MTRDRCGEKPETPGEPGTERARPGRFLRLCILSLCSLAGPAAAASPGPSYYVVADPLLTGIECQDIRAIDFRNFRLQTREAGEVGPEKEGEFLMQNGLYEIFTPQGEIFWRVVLEQDQTLFVAGGELVRLLLLRSTHLPSRKTFTRIFAFKCIAGRLAELLQAGAEGLQVQARDSRLELRFPFATPPSREAEVQLFTWDPRHQSFQQTAPDQP